MTSVRPALAKDSNAVYELICLLEGKTFDKASIEEIYHQNLLNKNNIYLVAEDNDEVIALLSCHGQLLLHHCGMVYEIQEMVTLDAYRSKGIGKMLLDELYKRLAGIDHDILEVTSNNIRTQAHNFYLKNGFSQTHKKFTRKD